MATAQNSDRTREIHNNLLSLREQLTDESFRQFAGLLREFMFRHRNSPAFRATLERHDDLGLDAAMLWLKDKKKFRPVYR